VLFSKAGIIGGGGPPKPTKVRGPVQKSPTGVMDAELAD